MLARTFTTALSLWLLQPQSARATGSLDRLKGVSQFARSSGPQSSAHLWVGAGFAALVLVLIVSAVCWNWKRKNQAK